MSIVRRQPWTAINQLHNELDRIFDPAFSRSEEGQTVTDWVPAVDIREEEKGFVIRADVPGVNPEDIEITMENGVLSIRGQRASVSETERDGLRRVERVSGQFFRRFTLPDTADAEGITARSEHGVLEVSIPKHARVQPRKISVLAQ